MSIYGVEWSINDSIPLLTRIGDLTLHRADTGLPVQSLMKRCLLLDDGTVNYYLNPTNSLQKEDLSAAVLDGTDGQVMVEIPEYYIKFESAGDLRRVLISLNPFEKAIKIPKSYVSAFEATVFRTGGNKLSSVINTTAAYRGGNNNATLDAQPSSQLGMPATAISRINFTTFARNRGADWDQLTYNVYKSIVWLYMIEYANRNSQDTFNNTLTAEGYRQGGLGPGVTNINSTAWGNFNGFYPFVPCGSGAMNNFNNATTYVHPTLGTTEIPQYRGIEHPFGHIWKWVEGINIRAFPTKEYIYTTKGRTFSSSNYNDYTFISKIPITSNYIRDIVFGATGEIVPKSVTGANQTTFWCDQWVQSRPSSGEVLRALNCGGVADIGVAAGLLRSSSNGVPASSSARVGGRLCFSPLA